MSLTTTLRVIAASLVGSLAPLTALLLMPFAATPAPATPGITSESLVVSPGRTGFTLFPSTQTHLTFTNRLDEWAGASNRVLTSGSGVAAGDYDRDGRVDIFLCSLNQRNRLFRNMGNWVFQDVTEEAGLRFPSLFYRAAVFADVNGDGWLDLLIGTVSQGVRCYLSNQRGGFVDATFEANTTSPFANSTLALADVDGNGTLDLYACNNRSEDIRDQPRVPIVFVNKKPTVPPEMRGRISIESGTLLEAGEPDLLYLGDGYGHFRSVSWTNGAFFDVRGEVLTNAPLDWGLCATFRDLTGDGAPDLYICNDYWTPDRLWINGGRGRFKELDPLSLRKIPSSSMGADVADINRDGFPDIVAVDMLSRSSEMRRRQTVAKRAVAPRPGDLETRVQSPRNTLLLSRGDGTYAEIAWLAGVAASEWSWSPMFLDVDLDGFDDLLIGSGHIRDIQDFDANDQIRARQEDWRRSPMAVTNLQRAFLEARHDHASLYPPLPMPVVAYHNVGGFRFDEATDAWGLNDPAVNHGIALADFDGDGDLDVVVNRLESPAALYRNNGSGARIAVRLRGRPPNTQAVGARIELLGAAVSNQVQEVSCGGSYMSGSDTLRVLAPGASPGPFQLRVTWRDGTSTLVPEVKPNHRYEIDESVVPHTPASTAKVPARVTLFTDVSTWLNHRHQDQPFDDLARQPLLPRKFDQGGPGVSWFDLDGDGWEDLLVGSGRGGSMAWFANQKGRGFVRATNAFLSAVSTRDQTAVLGWHSSSNRPTILFGASSYEDETPDQPGAIQSDPTTGATSGAVPPNTSSVGPLTLADVDGDGSLELFVGGQIVPGRYPAPASSRVFRWQDARWTLDSSWSGALTNVGLINSAAWSDLDDDGRPELLLACEWGPIRVFQNRKDGVSEVTARWGLASFTGLWQSVTTGDFDGDGRLDIVAGNWGLNSSWQASEQRPLTLFYGDLAGRGMVDIIETEVDARGRLVPRHLRDHIAMAIPWIAERFPTHAAWSRATLEDILGDRRGSMRSLTASTLATTVFMNRGGHFEARSLPMEAQFAPAFGLAVADFDGDGREDLLLAQNFFAFPVEDSRLDAGRGLLLRGDGGGGFEAVPGQQSGVLAYGEQRGAAVADFDHDGRPDVVLGQNSAETKLFQNRTGRPGLRLRLAGPAGNPRGIGAIVRLKFARGWGPAREIHAGAGYWSQDSDCPVLATPEKPLAVQVRWPGGRTTEIDLPENRGEITVAP